MSAICFAALSGGALLSILLFQAAPARADGNPLNGASPRPFYIFAHNPNTLVGVRLALLDGANALEPDVTLAVCNTGDALDDFVDWDSSAPHRNGRCDDTKLVTWLDGVHLLAVDQPGLALIVFDLKSSVAIPVRGRIILDAIRKHLNFGGVNVNVILSVGTRDDFGAFEFDGLLDTLLPREGVMIDSENDAGAVVQLFFDRGYRQNIGYGDGTSGIGPRLVVAMDAAAWLRATIGLPRSVTYVYTIDLEDSMRTFIDAGVDEIITNSIPKLAAIVRGRSDVRLATRDDNPFLPLNEAYGLMIRTGDDGTDANVTFTLNGSLGSSKITVNTEPSGRMESGNTNFVTIPSRNLGGLKSITVENDGSGNRPDWLLQDITVQSARWLKPDPIYHYTARLNGTNRGHGFDVIPFRLDEFVWGGFSAVSDGTAASPWKTIVEAYRAVAPDGVIHVAAGAYVDNVVLSKPFKLMLWQDHGSGPVRIGSH